MRHSARAVAGKSPACEGIRVGRVLWPCRACGQGVEVRSIDPHLNHFVAGVAEEVEIAGAGVFLPVDTHARELEAVDGCRGGRR